MASVTIGTGSGNLNRLVNTGFFFPLDAGAGGATASFEFVSGDAAGFTIRYTNGPFVGGLVRYTGLNDFVYSTPSSQVPNTFPIGGTITTASFRGVGETANNANAIFAATPIAHNAFAATRFETLFVGNDTIAGTRSTANVLNGFGGNDDINGFGSLFGGEGDDTLSGNGAVLGDGGAGTDTVFFASTGGVGVLINPAESRWASIERWRGSNGNDTFAGTAGPDHYTDTGSTGALNSGYGDIILAGGGADTILSSGSFSTGMFIMGESGDDSVGATSVRDYVDGGAGADSINAAGDIDYVLGGDGNDTIAAGNSGDGVGSSAAALYEVVFAGTGDDVVANPGNTRTYVEGGAGNDTITGSNFNPATAAIADYLFGDEGNDSVVGGAGNDAVVGSTYRSSSDNAQVDTVIGGAGNDFVLQGLFGRGRLEGGDGDDSVVGAAGADTIVFGRGNDFGYGLGGEDVFEFRPADLGVGDVDGIVDLFDGVDVIRLIGIPRADVVFSSVEVGGAPFGLITIAHGGGTHSIFVTAGSATLVEARTEFL